jgi:hypothetical protein
MPCGGWLLYPTTNYGLEHKWLRKPLLQGEKKHSLLGESRKDNVVKSWLIIQPTAFDSLLYGGLEDYSENI